MPDKPNIDIARPPVYTPYPNPHLEEFVRRHLQEKPFIPEDDDYFKEPFVKDIQAGKNTAIYNAHSYHTKVPPQGIEPFIEHYTDLGDLILDPFCGSGMTGVAALKLGRKVILSDLSPAATFIAYNYCTPVDLDEFKREADRILAEVKSEMDWLYETWCRKCGGSATIEYTIWSDTFRCLFCGREFALWDAAVDRESGKVRKRFPCPVCKMEVSKTQCKRTGSKPVRVNYNCWGNCGRMEEDISDFDMRKIEEIESREIPYWYPTDRMPPGDESRRNDKISITHVHHFYTKRNLWMLASLWAKIGKINDNRIRNCLHFAFTNTCWHGTVMRRFNARGGDRPLSGTLYVPSIPTEANMVSVLKHKFRQLDSAYTELNAFLANSVINCRLVTQSATNLSQIPDSSIDYCFTDPPFGANLMYSELNFLWEAWLREFTNNTEEAIINKTQGKDVLEYQELMTKCFREIRRVLKPGRWMTMVFHNSDGRIWHAIQEGLKEAGFDIGSIHTFDKKHGSFKQITTEGAVGYDIIINCFKPAATIKNGFRGKTTEEAIVGFLTDRLRELDREHSDERTARMLHSKTIGFFMQRNYRIDTDYDIFRKLLQENFKDVDGYWYLWGQIPKASTKEPSLPAMGSIESEADAIDWLWRFLEKPYSWKEIHPRFLIALGSNKLRKDPRQTLEENFIPEGEGVDTIWRRPTEQELEGLNKTVDAGRYRLFRSWSSKTLEGERAEIPSDDVLKVGFTQYLEKERRYREIISLMKRLSEDVLSRIKELRMIRRIAEDKIREQELMLQ